MERKRSTNKLLDSLQERAKELDCLYRIGEILNQLNQPLDEVCNKVVEAIPPGWQFPEICQARMEIEGSSYCPADFVETPWVQKTNISVEDSNIGTLSVFYSREMPEEDDGPFLTEETKLLQTIGVKLGSYILQQKMRRTVQELERKEQEGTGKPRKMWQIVLHTLKLDQGYLFLRLSYNMLEKLRREGIPEANALYDSWIADIEETSGGMPQSRTMSPGLGPAVFDIAAKHLSDQQIQDSVQVWIQENKPNVLAKLVNKNLSITEIADAIQRYHRDEDDDVAASTSRLRGVQLSLIRRFLSDQPHYLSVARKFIMLSDFNQMLQRVIFSADSHGRLGGKGARLYLTERILRVKQEEFTELRDVVTPRTWYITSDVLFHFLHHQALDYVVQQKYKELSQVRHEYPDIVRTFMSAQFPPDIVNSVWAALDDLGDGPLVVRSSSVLDDKPEAAFSGMYKNVFISNRGSKQERVGAAMSAIAQVYASVWGPEPIKYRAECGLLDFGEEMGIMIQQVVGTKVGPYFMPCFSGTASSVCELTWLPGVKRQAGLVSLVPGLNPGQNERDAEDHPVLIFPSRPGKRVYDEISDKVKYSPKQIYLIDLKKNRLVTIPLSELLQQAGGEIPCVDEILSIYEDEKLLLPDDRRIDFARDRLIATFDGLESRTLFVVQIRSVLKTLEDVFGGPVQVEFASDGKKLHLLDCRRQICNQ